MFENLIRKSRFGGGAEGGGVKNKKETYVLLPDKVQKMLSNSSTKTIQGTYCFEVTKFPQSVRLDATDGGYLGKIHIVAGFNHLSDMIYARKAIQIQEYFSQENEIYPVLISFIPLEKQNFHPSPDAREALEETIRWQSGIFMLCVFPQ